MLNENEELLILDLINSCDDILNLCYIKNCIEQRIEELESGKE